MSVFRFRLVISLAAAGLALASLSGTIAQPQVPSTFWGSVAVNGKPVPDGTEIRGLVDGLDCTQLGPTYRGTLTDAGVSVYLINVVHETQKPGCGRPGRTVTFTVGGRAAEQTAPWQQGPQQLNLSSGQGEPPALPTATLARPVTPTAASASAAAEPAAGASPGPATMLATGEAQAVTATRESESSPEIVTARADEDGSSPVVYVLLIVLAGIVVTGAAVGIALGRRTSARGGGSPGDDGPGVD